MRSNSESRQRQQQLFSDDKVCWRCKNSGVIWLRGRSKKKSWEQVTCPVCWNDPTGQIRTIKRQVVSRKEHAQKESDVLDD